MYKKVIFIMLLAAAASGFPASGVEDIATAASGDKTLVRSKSELENPDELTENSDQLATNLRKRRNCHQSVFGICLDPDAMHRDDPTYQDRYPLYDPQIHNDGNRRDLYGLLGPMILNARWVGE